MNLHQLQTFSTVLIEKSMTAAAQKLFLTQSAVSQQIRQLEDELGIELLVRGTRQVAPTPAGSVLAEYSRKILHLVHQAELAVQTVSAEVKGPLRIGTLSSIGLQLISPIFGLFLKNNQEVSVKLRYGDGATLLHALDSGDLDVAIVPDAGKEFGGMSSSTYEARVVLQDEMWLVANMPSIEEGATLSNLAGLVQNPVIWLTQEFPGFENYIMKELKKQSTNLRPVFESSNVGTVKRVIESGSGWGFLPAHSVRKQVRSGRMKRIMIDNFEYPITLTCYFPKNLKSAKVLEVFLKALTGQLGS
jgi:LysR family transcriptional regulator, transcriptional activator of the cysJI operon